METIFKATQYHSSSFHFSLFPFFSKNFEGKSENFHESQGEDKVALESPES